ncbi:hypothetical protein [Amycolatopsis aidingensis]|uniref:hypothetical protein n=1 Tax=Amycolatopsis aidingensis TaxID=2842453 RepID=UPI001C0B7ADB|nr:hypothetical protein [Amycolatopsis aidingensis]
MNSPITHTFVRGVDIFRYAETVESQQASLNKSLCSSTDAAELLIDWFGKRGWTPLDGGDDAGLVSYPRSFAGLLQNHRKRLPADLGLAELDCEFNLYKG